MNNTKSLLEEINQASDSLEKLREINSTIHERKFHEHTHVLYDIRTFLGLEHVNFVEIGSYVGSSACLMLSHTYETSVTCIDPLSLESSHYQGGKDQETTLRHNLKKLNPHNRKYTIHKSLSWKKDVVDSVADVDILHIDGDHGYNSVIKDFDLYKDKVCSGGFIIFDDYHDYTYSPEVKPAVDDIVSNLDLNEYEVVGCLNNFHKIETEFPSNYSNFILRKC